MAHDRAMEAGSSFPTPDSLLGADSVKRPTMPSKTRLFWATYATACTVLSLCFVLARYFLQGRPLGDAVISSVELTAPAAVVGVGAVLLSRRWDWPPPNVFSFIGLHVAAAVGYSVLWVGSVSVIVASRRVAAGGSFEGPDLDNPFIAVYLFFGLLIYGIIVAVTYLARVVGRLHAERERLARVEALRARARLEALRAQVSPHFLFNAMHSATSLIRWAPERAERALERLAALLRYAIGRDGTGREDGVPLGRELEMIEAYLQLEKLRLGDRLTVEKTVEDDARGVRIPGLTVQPLVENAVKHALAPRAEGGTLEIEATVEGTAGNQSLVVAVRDDGPGASKADVRESEGAGLRLVRERLALRYGNQAGLEISTRPGEGFEVLIRVPPKADGVRRSIRRVSDDP